MLLGMFQTQAKPYRRSHQGCLLKERWKPGKNEQSGYDEFMVKLSEAVRTVAASQNYFPGK